MSQVDRLFRLRTWTATEEQRVRFRQVFAFDEHLVERGVALVGGLGRQDDFAVAGQRQPADAIAVIGQRDAPNLDVIVRRYTSP